MAMQPITLRFSASQLETFRAEAEIEGVSVAQYIRESALARAWYERGRRDPNNIRYREAIEEGRRRSALEDAG